MMRHLFLTIAATAASFAAVATAQPAPADGPYKVINSVKVGGVGMWDYVYADSGDRLLFIPRTGRPTGRVTVYDLDTLKSVGEIPGAVGVHGVVVDPTTGHGFVSCNPVIMFDPKTLATIKTIPVEGSPDGILFDTGTQRVFVLSHRSPNVTVINPADGSIAGTIDLGGEPEQGASDGSGKVYIDLESTDSVAVVDAKAMKLVATYSLNGQGGGPGGMAMDVKNHILFSFCHNPQNVVILNADDGKIITSLPIGNGVDAAEFNPDTMEAFSSQGDGTLTVIKENSPTSFVVEQNVQTKRGARTSTLDSKTGNIYLITADYAAPATRPATTPSDGGQAAGERPRRGRGQMVPGSFTILVVGKSS
jgi:hypothetical protein